MICAFLIGIMTILLAMPSLAQDHSGHHGHGHSQWHEGFYKNLMRKDTKTSCCNLADGEWIKADQSVIQNLSAPVGTMKGKIYCVVLPQEG